MKWNADHKILCSKCGQKPAAVKKLILCLYCYNKQYGRFLNHSIKRPRRSKDGNHNVEAKDISLIGCRNETHLRHKAEILFAQNHPDFLFHSTTFDLGSSSYTPDFYDNRHNVFYEVIGTRQRFEQLKDKIAQFRKLFPHINLEVVCADGQLYNSASAPEVVSSNEMLLS